MAGSLFIPPWATPFNIGVVMPGAKLFFYVPTTTTKRNTYTTSSLGVAHSNPVVADGYGRFPAIWLDPALAYKAVLAASDDTDPPAAAILTEDNIPVGGVGLIEGNFTGTLTGMTAATTGTVSYRVTANAAGTGKECRLYVSAGITGTSNTTAMTMTGLPAACQPTGSRTPLCSLKDNTTDVLGYAFLTSASGTITFAVDQPFSQTGFTNSGTKGLSDGWTISYAI
jgi:hypothetical protein